MTPPGAEAVGGYVLLREIGHGVHGRVYLARAESPGEDGDAPVALKLLDAPATEQGFQRVVEELRRCAALVSAPLVTIHEVGLEGATVFYAMRHHPLGSLASPSRQLPRQERVAAVARAARAAHALHEAGVVHRGIKPSNILMAAGGAVLAEPTTAHTLAPGQPLTGLGPRGSARDLEFVDPALVRGGEPGRSTDIWALGVTLHIALTGFGLYPALTSADPMVAARMYLRSRPEADAQLAPAQRQVVTAAVDPDPGSRYLTAETLAADIERLATEIGSGS